MVRDGRDECDKSDNDAQGGAIFAKEKERSDVVFSASSLCLNILFFDHGSNESERCKTHPSDR